MTTQIRRSLTEEEAAALAQLYFLNKRETESGQLALKELSEFLSGEREGFSSEAKTVLINCQLIGWEGLPFPHVVDVARRAIQERSGHFFVRPPDLSTSA